MRYHNTVEVDHLVFKHLKRFAAGKNAEDDLFDRINPSKLNDYLKEMMDNLSAKVFRTYNASITLQEELYKIELLEDES
jgi:DNA topoisomerase-1